MSEKPLIIGGKTYISSKRAASVFNYTTDYVGQLSRSGKIGSILVGRDRFVDYSSLSRYVELLGQERSLPVPIAPPAGITSRSRSIMPIASGLIVSMLIVFLSLSMLPRSFFVSPTDLASTPALIQQTELLSAEVSVLQSVLEPFRVFLGKVDSYYLSALDNIDGRLVKFWNETRFRFLAFLESISGSYQTKTSFVKNQATTNTSSNNPLASAPVATTGFSEDEVRGIVRQVVDQELVRVVDYVSEASKINRGLVVTPSTGSSTSDLALRNAIKNSFSDEVEIRLDDSLDSGTIHPVFKLPTDDEYMFIIVPVNNRE